MNFKKPFSIFLIFWIISLSFNIHAGKREIVKAINAIDSNPNIGIKIRNLKTNKIVYEQNADRYYTFASSIKMITIFSLLKYFGSDYVFTSKIWKKDQDYYLDVNDPDFSTADLEFLINKLKMIGLNKLEGNFYIVDRKFSLSPLGEGSMIEDSNYCYGAPITKVHINKNCLRLNAAAALNLKKPISLTIKELTPYKIINKAYTISNKDHPKIKMRIENDKLIISGTLNKPDNKIVIGAVINNSLDHVKRMLESVLNNSDVIIKKHILLTTSLPKDSKVLASTAKTFTELGSKALKISDNFITDYLMAEFGTHYAKEEWKDCGNLLKQLILQQFNIDFSNSIIVDGSGLSRYNIFSVKQFDEFLAKIYNNADFDKLVLMLARPNEKGTLEKRFKNIKIFAKTGTLAGVSSLVGYMFDKNNVPYSFVIVTNNYYGSKANYAELEEAILTSAIP